MKRLLLSACILWTSLFSQAQLTTTSSCDTNADGQVNIVDVNNTISKILGNAATESQVVSAEQLNTLLQSIDKRLSAIESKLGITPVVDVQEASFATEVTSLKINETYTQTVTTSSDGAVKYISSDPTIATVDATSGMVTAIAVGSTTITAIISATSTYRALSASYTINVEASNIINGHEYVDLGLPSGTLWATCNVGANNSEDYGDYFAWGETTPHNNDSYYFTDYKWCNGSNTTLTKYCSDSNYGTVDNKTELELADDAAYVNWGSDWQMPSLEQIQELINNNYTTNIWTTKNHINGILITSLTNGNTLFLPAGGWKGINGFHDEGSSGQYWTRNLGADGNYCAYDLDFYSDKTEWKDDGTRNGGQNIRPVCILK